MSDGQNGLRGLRAQRGHEGAGVGADLVGGHAGLVERRTQAEPVGAGIAPRRHVVRRDSADRQHAGIAGQYRAHRLEDLIARVHRDPDGATLYVARLQELLADPDASGKLGLYRIRYEGGFQLASKYEGQVLTITATRGIP